MPHFLQMVGIPQEKLWLWVSHQLSLALHAILHQVRHLTYFWGYVKNISLFEQLSYQIAPQGFDHPDLPALRVANEVLNAPESFLWKAIRGSGLAYKACLGHNPESGHVFLEIHSSPDSWMTVTKTGQLIRDLIDGKV